MEINKFFNASTESEIVKYKTLRFRSINIDYFIDLYDWHGKKLEDVEAIAFQLEGDMRDTLILQQTLIAMIHTATFPYQKDISFDAWKTTISSWVVTDTELVKWFMEYFQTFLPEEGKKK